MVKIRQLSPELAKKATRELQESEARINVALKRIKEWFLLRPHLKVPIDDQYLVAFIRGCKFSLEKIFEKIDQFYTLRTQSPEFFKNRDPTISPLNELIERGIYLPLENKTDPSGPIFLYVHANYDPSKYQINDLMKYSYLILDILTYDYDQANISGQVSIIDCENISLDHLTSYSPSVAKKSLTAYADIYPMPSLGQHYINPPTGFETLITLLKLFLPPSTANKIHVHPNLESLYQYVPKENLPNEYGGNAGTISELTEKWKSIIISHKDFLVEGEKYVIDENLRPATVTTNNASSGPCSIM